MQDGIFSYVILEQRVPREHPLREIRKLTDVVLRSLSTEFNTLYAASGRPSIAPEYVLRALLLQAFYSVRSECQLVEGLDYNLLFRWFVGVGMDDAVRNHAVFSKNRDSRRGLCRRASVRRTGPTMAMNRTFTSRSAATTPKESTTDPDAQKYKNSSARSRSWRIWVTRWWRTATG